MRMSNAAEGDRPRYGSNALSSIGAHNGKKEIYDQPDLVYSGDIPPRDAEQPEREERINLLDPVIELYPNKATLWL